MKKEIFELVSLAMITLLFQGALNLFLTLARGTKYFKILLWSLLINILSWLAYRLLMQHAVDQGMVGTLISALTFGNALLYWLLLRLGIQNDESFKEGRIWGWILFSPLLGLMTLMCTPLLAAILLSTLK